MVLRLAEINFARGAVERNPVAFLHGDGLAAHCHREHASSRSSIADRARAHNAGPAHAARHHSRVARLAADRGQNALAPHPCRECRPAWFPCGPGSPDRLLRHLDRVFGRERHASHRGARRRRDTGGQLRQLLRARPDRTPDAAIDRAASGPRAAPLPSSSISPSSTISTATRTAAGPVRLPLRVCSMYSLPSWMVNSKSCMSL